MVVHAPCSQANTIHGYTDQGQIGSKFRLLVPRSGLRARIVEASAVSIDVLVIDRMNHIFRVVEPSVSNLGAFGHEVRNLL